VVWWLCERERRPRVRRCCVPWLPWLCGRRAVRVGRDDLEITQCCGGLVSGHCARQPIERRWRQFERTQHLLCLGQLCVCANKCLCALLWHRCTHCMRMCGGARHNVIGTLRRALDVICRAISLASAKRQRVPQLDAKSF